MHGEWCYLGLQHLKMFRPHSRSCVGLDLRVGCMTFVRSSSSVVTSGTSRGARIRPEVPTLTVGTPALEPPQSAPRTPLKRGSRATVPLPGPIWSSMRSGPEQAGSQWSLFPPLEFSKQEGCTVRTYVCTYVQGSSTNNKQLETGPKGPLTQDPPS